jgi:hypothetical protein
MLTSQKTKNYTRADTVVVGLAGLDIITRTVLDTSSLVSELVATAFAVLLATTVDSSILGWILGWSFLAALAYKLHSHLIQTEKDTDDGGTRLILLMMTAISVSGGMSIRQQVFGHVFGLGLIPHPFREAVYYLLMVLVLLHIILVVPAFDVPNGNYNADLVMALVISPILSLADLLYPLPELAVILGIATVIGSNYIRLGPKLDYIVIDPVEKLSLGITAARFSHSAAVGGFYAYMGILIPVTVIAQLSPSLGAGFFDTLGHIFSTSVESGSWVEIFQTRLYLSTVILGSIIYLLWYWTRIIEALPTDLNDYRSRLIGTSRSIGHDGDQEADYDFPKIPYGYGLPGLLFFTAIGDYSFSDLRGSIAPLDQTSQLAVLLVTLVAIASIVLSQRVGHSPRNANVSKLAARSILAQLVIVYLPVISALNSVVQYITSGEFTNVSLYLPWHTVLLIFFAVSLPWLLTYLGKTPVYGFFILLISLTVAKSFQSDPTVYPLTRTILLGTSFISGNLGILLIVRNVYNTLTGG